MAMAMETGTRSFLREKVGLRMGEPFKARRKSLKEAKGHPVFAAAKYLPPITSKHLNSSGESSGGSSEWAEAESPTRLTRRLCHSVSSLDCLNDQEDEVLPEGDLYGNLLHVMETDPRWREERGRGRAIGMYRIYGEIGSGNFARVRLGVHQLLRERVAIKIIDKSRVESKLEKMMGREVSCLDSLAHPNILRLYQVLETPWKLYLVSEWAPAGDLYAKVTLRGRLSETEARPIFTQILSAVTFMHNQGIVHRDLKAENIFFSTATHCKLGDLGFSTLARKGQLLSTFCGSPPYAAPELFRDEPYDGFPVDVWALGVLLYFMLEGSLPFIAPSIPSLRALILSGLPPFNLNLSPQVVTLLEGIFRQRPTERLTLSQILRNHWLRGIRRQDTTGLLLPATRNRAYSSELPTKQQLANGLLSSQEVAALKYLNRLGISRRLIEAERGSGVRSQVTGIYRILLHKLQQGQEISENIFKGQDEGGRNGSSSSSSTAGAGGSSGVIPQPRLRRGKNAVDLFGENTTTKALKVPSNKDYVQSTTCIIL